MNLELHQFVVEWDLPNPSPFCLKVETFLRLAELPYTVHAWSPMAAPLGKAPFIVRDGEILADSSNIIRTLSAHTALDTPFSNTELARGRALNRMLEEHTYWAILYLRWLQDDAWASYRQVIGAAIPALIRTPMTAWLRRGVRQAAHHHGLSRHPKDEILRRVHEDLDSLEASIAGPFVLGEHPCSVDAGVYAMLEGLSHPLGTEALASRFEPGTALHAYRGHMRQRAWPDWTFPTA